MGTNILKTPLKLTLTTALAAAVASTGISTVAQDSPRRGSNTALLEEVLVTARKREESSLDVPLAITAFGAEQIDALKIRELTSLAVGMPNVALDDIGTTRGVANFTIRGLGINSSIPSIDPTVGVFVDGVYMGLNSGIIFDTFDLESIEVLRGPQGTLFGRNVTGGAVLLNTKLPGEEFEATVRATVETGGEDINTYLMGSIGGPISDTVAAKLTVYTNQDEGWFKNKATGDAFGEADTLMIRPVVTWQPSDDVHLTLRYEYQETDGDGPAAQSHTNGLGKPNVHGNYKRDSFDFAVDEVGFQKAETDFFVAQLDWNVGFGNGTITNIFGWRDYQSDALSDIDASVSYLFHAPSQTEAEQFSNELRYTGTFNGNLTITAGIYYFTNDLSYQETRNLLGLALPANPNATPPTPAKPRGIPALSFYGGGNYKVDTSAFFYTMDYDVSDDFTLIAGLRYTKEKKEADIASLILNANKPCNVLSGTCPIDFRDDDEWTNVSPKIGFTYQMSENLLTYAHWTRGFRSGGYNLRNTSAKAVRNPADFGPGPFDEEQISSFEVGFKVDLGGRGRVTGAMFMNDIEDMQRELNSASEGAGVVQIVRNTADADIFGVELDGVFALSDSLLLLASVGYLNAEYTDILSDLNGDDVINGADKNLALPRAADLTYSIGFSHSLEVDGWGYMTSRINFAYRDESAYTDNNLGYVSEQEILDAGIDFYSNDGHWVIGVYGKNLLDEVKHGGDTALPDVLGPVPLGGTFSPLAKGGVYGVEVTYSF